MMRRIATAAPRPDRVLDDFSPVLSFSRLGSASQKINDEKDRNRRTKARQGLGRTQPGLELLKAGFCVQKPKEVLGQGLPVKS
jgi:hypothetical protein